MKEHKVNLNLNKIQDERKHARLEVESLKGMLEIVVTEIKRLESGEDFNLDKKAQSKHKNLTQNKLEISLELVRKEIEKLKKKLTPDEREKFRLNELLGEETKIKDEIVKGLEIRRKK